MPTVNLYYDWTGELSDDGEGGLVALCRPCAKAQGEQVQLAARGHDEAECALCPATNDPDYTHHVNSLMDQFNRD